MNNYFQSAKAYIGSVTLFSLAGIIVNLAGMLVGFTVARRLTTHDYGQYAYLTNVFLLFSVIFGFGLTAQISKDLAERDEAQLSHTISGLTALRLATAGLALGGGLLIAWLSGNELFGWAGAGAGLFVYTDYMSGALSGVGRFKSTALVIAVQPLSYLAMLLCLPVTSLTTLYIIFLISQLLSALAATGLALVDSTLRQWPRLRALRQLRWKEMVAVDLSVLIFLQTLYSSFGVAVLGTADHYAEAGALSIAFTIIQLPNILVSLVIAKLYYPRMCGLYKNGSSQSQLATFSITYYICALVSLGYTALILVYADVFVNTLYSSSHADAVPVVRWLALLSFFQIANQVLSWTLVAANRQRLVLIATGLSMALLLIVLLLPLSAPVIATGYIASSLVGWLLMFSRSVLGATVFKFLASMSLKLGMGLLGILLALGVRFVLATSPWPLYAIGGVGFVCLLYGLCSLIVLFYLFNKFIVNLLSEKI